MKSFKVKTENAEIYKLLIMNGKEAKYDSAVPAYSSSTWGLSFFTPEHERGYSRYTMYSLDMKGYATSVAEIELSPIEATKHLAKLVIENAKKEKEEKIFVEVQGKGAETIVLFENNGNVKIGPYSIPVETLDKIKEQANAIANQREIYESNHKT